ncbi:MFS transporter [Sporolactobacillus sp. THM19-2]|uniref:MFS transporter n=1 Tax=Sporolactobacillus sp. THM19-2 TaxID=2511171 RepID=UPI0013EB11ED|nr:MFS transporter [Sporolactobacillus sp. THM19-2]
MDLLLHNRAYLMLWLSTLTTRFGNALTLTVLMFMIGSSAKSPLMISLVLLAQMTPMILIGLFAGTIADRLPKFAVMMGSEYFQLLTVIAMTLFLDQPQVLLLLIFLQGTGAAFFSPAKTAFISEIVAKDKIPDAIGLSQGVGQATDLIGPPLAGALLLLIPGGDILIIDAVTFFISAFLIFVSSRFAQINGISNGGRQKERLLQSITCGLKEVATLPELQFLIIIVFVLMLAAGVFNATSIAIELQVFGVNGFEYGLLEALTGFGAITGSLVGPLLIKRIRPGQFIVSSGVVLGLWMALIYVVSLIYPVTGLYALSVWVIGLGLLNSCLNIPVSSLFLLVTPPAFRGRAAGILQMFSFLGCVIGILAGGALSVPLGVIPVTIFAGLLMGVVSFGMCLTAGYKRLITIQTEKKSVTSSRGI